MPQDGDLDFQNGVWLIWDGEWVPVSDIDPLYAGILAGFDGVRQTASGGLELHQRADPLGLDVPRWVSAAEAVDAALAEGGAGQDFGQGARDFTAEGGIPERTSAGATQAQDGVGVGRFEDGPRGLVWIEPDGERFDIPDQPATWTAGPWPPTVDKTVTVLGEGGGPETVKTPNWTAIRSATRGQQDSSRLIYSTPSEAGAAAAQASNITGVPHRPVATTSGWTIRESDTPEARTPTSLQGLLVDTLVNQGPDAFLALDGFLDRAQQQPVSPDDAAAFAAEIADRPEAFNEIFRSLSGFVVQPQITPDQLVDRADRFGEAARGNPALPGFPVDSFGNGPPGIPVNDPRGLEEGELAQSGAPLSFAGLPGFGQQEEAGFQSFADRGVFGPDGELLEGADLGPPTFPGGPDLGGVRARGAGVRSLAGIPQEVIQQAFPSEPLNSFAALPGFAREAFGATQQAQKAERERVKKAEEERRRRERQQQFQTPSRVSFN